MYLASQCFQLCSLGLKESLRIFKDLQMVILIVFSCLDVSLKTLQTTKQGSTSAAHSCCSTPPQTFRGCYSLFGQFLLLLIQTLEIRIFGCYNFVYFFQDFFLFDFMLLQVLCISLEQSTTEYLFSWPFRLSILQPLFCALQSSVAQESTYLSSGGPPTSMAQGPPTLVAAQLSQG